VCPWYSSTVTPTRTGMEYAPVRAGSVHGVQAVAWRREQSGVLVCQRASRYFSAVSAISPASAGERRATISDDSANPAKGFNGAPLLGAFSLLPEFLCCQSWLGDLLFILRVWRDASASAPPWLGSASHGGVLLCAVATGCHYN
jgi:hypothetical protein